MTIIKGYKNALIACEKCSLCNWREPLTKTDTFKVITAWDFVIIIIESILIAQFLVHRYQTRQSEMSFILYCN